MSDYGDFPVGPTDEQLTSVVSLAEYQIHLENQVLRCQEALDNTKALLRQVQERDLPEAMSLAGMEKFSLKNGYKVAVTTKIDAQPLKDNQPAMLDWIKEHRYEDIIKHEIKIDFGKGQDAAAEQLMQWVTNFLPNNKIADKRFVHPMTLSAFVREQVAQQVELPDVFGVTVLTKSVIKRPKTETEL